VFKFDVNDVHMGAIDMNLMSDVPDGHGTNASPEDMDYFGGDATLEDGSDRRTRTHKFGNATVDERTRDSFIGSVRINTEDMWHCLKDDLDKEKVARRHRGDKSYNMKGHQAWHMKRRCENLTGCEEEMVRWSGARDAKGRTNKPEMKFEIVIQPKDYRSFGASKQGALWRDITDKSESDYSPAFADYMKDEFTQILNHPTSGRFSSLDGEHFESSSYAISRDYVCGSLRKDDRVHVIDADAAFTTQHHREGIVKGVDRNFSKNGLVKVEFGDGVLQSIHVMNLRNAVDEKGIFQCSGIVEYRAKDDLVERAKMFDAHQVRLRRRNPARISVDKIEVSPTGLRLTCRGPSAPVYSPDFGMLDYVDGLAKGNTRSGSHAAKGGRDISHMQINRASLMVLADKAFIKVDNARKMLRENRSMKSAGITSQRSDIADVQLAIRVADQLYDALKPDNNNLRDLDAHVADKWFFPLTKHEMDKLANQLTELERFSTNDTDAHMQYEGHEGGNSISFCQWLPFEPSKAQRTVGMTPGRIKVKMKLQMREMVEPYDTAEFVPHHDLIKILHKINGAFSATENWLMAMSRQRDHEVMKVIKLQRDLGIRIRNEARMNVLTKKLNFMAVKDDDDAPRAIREYKLPQVRKEVKSKWLPDARTGQLEPILDLVDEVRMLCALPVYRSLIKDRAVEIPRPMFQKVRGQNTLIGKPHKYATLVLEEEQLLPAELGQEDGQKVLQQELHLVRQKIRMALLEGEEIRETMNQEIVLVPRMTVSWTNKFKGIATKKQLYQMQKQLTAQDLPGLRDDEVDAATKMRAVIKLRQDAAAKEDLEFEYWKEDTVARTNSISRTLTQIGTALSRKASYLRPGANALPRHTPYAGS